MENINITHKKNQLLFLLDKYIPIKYLNNIIKQYLMIIIIKNGDYHQKYILINDYKYNYTSDILNKFTNIYINLDKENFICYKINFNTRSYKEFNCSNLTSNINFINCFLKHFTCSPLKIKSDKLLFNSMILRENPSLYNTIFTTHFYRLSSEGFINGMNLEGLKRKILKKFPNEVHIIEFSEIGEACYIVSIKYPQKFYETLSVLRLLLENAS
jgi:hypothetical protein